MGLGFFKIINDNIVFISKKRKSFFFKSFRASVTLKKDLSFLWNSEM